MLHLGQQKNVSKNPFDKRFIIFSGCFLVEFRQRYHLQHSPNHDDAQILSAWFFSFVLLSRGRGSLYAHLSKFVNNGRQ